MSGEVFRKSIHISSLAVPIFYSFFSKSQVLMFLLPMTVFAVFVDYGRHYIPWVDRFFKWLFGPILREHEQDNSKKLISGGSYVLISACLSIIIFPKVIAITAFAILIISDAISALIGRRFGKRPFLDKSVIGSTSFALSAFIVVFLSPKAMGLPIEYVIGCIAAMVGTLVEAMSVRLKLDDNFSVPSSIGLTMWLAYFLLTLSSDPIYAKLFTVLMQ